MDLSSAIQYYQEYGYLDLIEGSAIYTEPELHGEDNKFSFVFTYMTNEAIGLGGEKVAIDLPIGQFVIKGITDTLASAVFRLGGTDYPFGNGFNPA